VKDGGKARAMKQGLAALLAIVMAANGAAMLAAGGWWYGVVPGVPQTGPYNPHFVKDIGATYLVVALGLAWFAARPRQGWPALVAGAVFLVLHGFIHIADAIASPVCGQNLLRDTPGVFLPAIIAVGLALSSLPKREGVSHVQGIA
jgi:hypothetical protein